MVPTRQHLPTSAAALRPARSALFALVFGLCGLFGCRTLNLINLTPQEKTATKSDANAPITAPPGAPNKYCVRIPPYVFVSDVEIDKDLPLFRDLALLRDQVARQLHLPVGTATIQVYIFDDQDRYKSFMDNRYPKLPPRRAFFIAQQRTIGSKDDLLVYTWQSPKIQQDLRHELTHALLHSVLKDVPLWLDEGLAEYFELTAEQKCVNASHLHQLLHGPAGPIKPDLARLEGLREVKDMNPPEYREAWGWVHLMLNGKSEARSELLNYLVQLKDTNTPPLLAPRLSTVYPNLNEALLAHLTDLEARTNSPVTQTP
jgi:hypothetical protein